MNKTSLTACYSMMIYDKLYSPQMLATIYEYTIKNNLTKKREKRKKETHTYRAYITLLLLILHVYTDCILIL